MSLLDAYYAIKDIRYRLSSNNSPIEVMEAKQDYVLVCKGDICFEIQKPEKVNKTYVVPVTKWERRGRGNKLKMSFERKYVPLADFNYYMNTTSFRDFTTKMKLVREVQEYENRLKAFFDYLYFKFIGG